MTAMESVLGFLAMGGYAAFVWPAYAVAAAVLIGLVLASLAALRAREAELRRLEADTPRGRRAAREERRP